MGVATEDASGFSGLPRSLSLWWSEETEYVLQSIERLAAYARGYNRLRSARLSPGRMTMHDEPADSNRWTINRATNRLVVETSWAPSFSRHHHYQQQQQRNATFRPVAERSPLRCCGTQQASTYRANGNLDSNCLEAYSLDHSIYFKTVGEVRRGPREDDNNNNNEVLDCGDFLASDFADDDDYDEDALELRERLMMSREDDDQRPGVVQLCRSREDEANNNNNNTSGSSVNLAWCDSWRPVSPLVPATCTGRVMMQ
ncbi:uncharacterized protein LOC106641046 [Copidosoma floridanum]|uniref:uncharacterized protein LOC106641046 n=1 Tax=Copidosoma floridanum TaxID=29053 RepID=UPI0006C9491F|nr:uncharacterized protein LOC106641046 [Copidosoma floridanum]